MRPKSRMRSPSLEAMRRRLLQQPLVFLLTLPLLLLYTSKLCCGKTLEPALLH